VKRRVGVLLAGCGALDGTDPFEAVFAMEAVQELGHEALPLVADLPQMHVVDHTTGDERPGESRALAHESARLGCGKLYFIQDLSPKLLDALVIPGGQGAVKNLLQNFGAPEPPRIPAVVADFVTAVHQAGGAVGAISLGEFVLNALFKPAPDQPGCLDLEPGAVWSDPDRRLALAAGHLIGAPLPDLRRGVHSLVRTLLNMAESSRP
jgi:enhancing lycopene biosynthesis protein 2